MVCCLKAVRCDRGLSKAKLFNSRSRDKRWDERDREASVRIYRGASVPLQADDSRIRNPFPNATTDCYRWSPDDRPTFVPSICLSSIHAKQIRLRTLACDKRKSDEESRDEMYKIYVYAKCVVLDSITKLSQTSLVKSPNLSN